MDKLTPFQIETAERLRGAAKVYQFRLPIPVVAGVGEKYLYYAVDDVELWIYTDGACIIGRGVDHVLELASYKTPGRLQHAFIDEASTVLRHPDITAI